MTLRLNLLAAFAALATLGAAQAQQAQPAPPPSLPDAMKNTVPAPMAPPAPAPMAPAAAPPPAAAPAAKLPPPMTTEKTTMSEGRIAHYGAKFNGRKTASGERFDVNAMTMAHKTLPFGTRVKVTNLANKKSVVVRVNDRGPAQPDRIGDLTTGAARKIGMTKAGVVDARLEVVGMAAAKSAKKKK